MILLEIENSVTTLFPVSKKKSESESQVVITVSSVIDIYTT